VLISAIEHYSYCPRQCGLIHLEAVWDENVLTLKGSRVHERVDQLTSRSEKNRRVERALPIWSEEHGLIGKADVVEFCPLPQSGSSLREGVGGASLRPYPVEYKSGKRTRAQHDQLQLCAQALCLEEMFQTDVPEGAIYYAQTKERYPVELTTELRERTIQVVQEIRAMMKEGALPAPANDRRCPRCSLVDACIPGAVANAASAKPGWLLHPANLRDFP
jgi:CRISPR-associated exonuclease Cas4